MNDFLDIISWWIAIGIIFGIPFALAAWFEHLEEKEKRVLKEIKDSLDTSRE